MSTQAVSDPAVAALLERIQSGEPIDDILRPKFEPAEEGVFKRAAVPRTFDRALYDALLRGDEGPSFDSLARDARTETFGHRPKRCRVRPDLQPYLRGLWWPDGRVPARPQAPPPDLADLLQHLVDHYAASNDPLERLYHLCLLDEDAAVQLLRELYRTADAQFDLARCQDVIAAVGLDERPSLIGPKLRSAANDLARSLRVRGTYATDYYRTARFFVPDGLEADIATLLDGSAGRVFQVVAEGGMGKTMRVRWFIARKCIVEGIPVARIDFDDIDPVVVGTDPWLVLLEFALQLHDQLPGTPFDKLAADFGEYRGLLRRGSQGDGKSSHGIDLQTIRKRAETQVPKRVRAGLAESAGGRTVILILDTTEEAVLPVARDISELWRQLAFLVEEPGVRLILAGRYDLGPRSEGFAAAFPGAPVQQIQPFSDAQAEAYLRGRAIEDAALMAEIVRESDGRPFKLALFGDIVAQRPDLTAEDVAAYQAPDLLFLVERVLDRIPDRGVRWLLRYGVIPRWLSLPVARDLLGPYLARAMAGDPAFDDPADDAMPPTKRLGEPAFPTGIEPEGGPSVDRLWETLRDYAAVASWVSMDGDSLRFQPEVVEPMREVLRGRPAWTILQGAAAEWYERLAEEEPDGWGRWIAEAAYHRFQRDGEDAIAWWRQQLDRAWSLGRLDWLRRLVDAAPRVVDPGAPDGVAAAGEATTPALAPGSTVIAEFESAAIETIEIEGREAPPTDPGWESARQRLEAAASLDGGRGFIPAVQLSIYRATIAYGQGAVDAALDQIAAARLVASRDIDKMALDTLYAEVVVGSGSSDSDRATAEALDRLATLSRSGDPTLEGTIVHGVHTLARTELRNDRVAQAIDVYEAGLGILARDAHGRFDLALLAADAEARWGRPGAALTRLESVRTDRAERAHDLRVEVIRARAELAARRPTEAIRATGAVLGELSQLGASADAAFDPVELEATTREIRGAALAESMLHTGALDELDRARGLWSSRHDAEGVGRTLVAAATVQVRGRGDVSQARQFLDGLQSSAPAVGGDAWTDSELLRAEWYARTGDQARAGGIVDETLDSLEAAPARRIRAGVIGLAIGPETDRMRHLGTLLQALRGMAVGSIRLAFLRDIEMVPWLGGQAPPEDLHELRELGSGTDGLTTPIDDALARLRIVEVERITGEGDAARARLEGLLGDLAALGAWAALDDALDAALRLDDLDLALDIGETLERAASNGSVSPEARAGQVARLAPAAIARERLDEAEGMLAEVEPIVAQDPRSRTAAQILLARASLARRRGDREGAGNALRVAADTCRGLGDPLATSEVDSAIHALDLEVPVPPPLAQAPVVAAVQAEPAAPGRAPAMAPARGGATGWRVLAAIALVVAVLYISLGLWPAGEAVVGLLPVASLVLVLIVAVALLVVVLIVASTLVIAASRLRARRSPGPRTGATTIDSGHAGGADREAPVPTPVPEVGTPTEQGAPSAAETAVHVQIDVRGVTLTVTAFADDGRKLGRRATDTSHGEPAVGRLDEPDAPVERALERVIESLGADWRAYGIDLGASLSLDWLADAGAPVDVSIWADHHLLHPIPWELASSASSGPIALDPRIASVTRVGPSRSLGIEEVRYAQATIARVMGTPMVADGLLGPQTEQLLRTFQREAGLPEDGVVGKDTLAALRERALEAQPFPPRAVLVRTGFERQVRGSSVGYESTFGVDLYRLYDSAGYRVELLEAPDIGALASYVSDPSTAIVHFAAGIRLTSGGIVSLDFGRSLTKRAMDASEWTPSLIGRALTGSGEAPLVVIDVPRPSSGSEAARQLVLRNRFASDLFDVLNTAAVLATGLMGYATADSHGILLQRLRAADSVAEASTAARRVSAPGSDSVAGLPDVAAAAAIALFARTPYAGIGLGRAAR